MLPEVTIRHINKAIRQCRTFALALPPGCEEPLWFEDGLCYNASPEGRLTDKQYSFEISPWLGRFNDRGIIGKKKIQEVMLVQRQSTSKDEYLEAVGNVIKSCSERYGKTVYSRIICSDLIENPMERWGELANVFFEQFPLTFRYVFYTPETKGWMGATPELLLDFDKTTGEFHTVAFAGTRKSGSSESWDAKNVHENRIVLDYIIAELKNMGIDATASDLFTINYGAIEHLCSHITGSTRVASLPEIIDAINPTPALCGFPKLSAIDDIRRYERHDRYCYGGFIAVNEPNRYRAFVNLRCLHFDEVGYSIYGGGGIMPESNPYSEFEETEAKTSLLCGLLEKISAKKHIV